jgi:predicted protein tyrosine phosphatase
MSSIYVCNLLEMPAHVEGLQPSHLVSLVAPTEQPPTPMGIAGHRHHRVAIHDISEPLDGHILPDAEHIEGLIDFVRAWPHDETPILIHCIAGISRSMAAALITLVIKAPGRELEAARHVRNAAPHAYPNRRMIAVADQLLGCGGRLIDAREAMGPADLLPLAPLVHLPLLP